VGLTGAAEQQAQIVLNLGDGADRGARVVAGGFLIDRDRRRQPLDRIDIRLVDLAEELPRIRRQAFDVAALAGIAQEALMMSRISSIRYLLSADPKQRDTARERSDTFVKRMQDLLASVNKKAPKRAKAKAKAGSSY